MSPPLENESPDALKPGEMVFCSLDDLAAIDACLSKLIGKRLNHILDDPLRDLHMKQKPVGMAIIAKRLTSSQIGRCQRYRTGRQIKNVAVPVVGREGRLYSGPEGVAHRRFRKRDRVPSDLLFLSFCPFS